MDFLKIVYRYSWFPEGETLVDNLIFLMRQHDVLTVWIMSSVAVGWITIKFGPDIQSPQQMDFNAK